MAGFFIVKRKVIGLCRIETKSKNCCKIGEVRLEVAKQLRKEKSGEGVDGKGLMG